MIQTHAKTTLKIIGGFIGIILFIFLAYLTYYMWQFKYGDIETVSRITSSYDDQFSQALNKDTPENFSDFITLIRSHNPTRGERTAPITLIAFIDFECPYCQKNYMTFSEVISQFGPAIQVVFKQLPLTAIHPDALDASLASTCAQEQNKFWEYHNRLFETKQLTRDALISHATTLGLNTTQFTTCLDSQRYISDIQEDMQDAVRVGVRGTPTFLINGTVIEGVATKEDWNTLLLNHLK